MVMDDTEPLLSIGAFARRVGLAPSALRFYDDCGVLRPASVDQATGYRYYCPDQEHRAVLIRRLREAGLPLIDASVVLDGTRTEARAVLEGHARRTRDLAAATQRTIEDILGDLSGGALRATALIGGAELSSAVRQVASAVAPAGVRAEFPALGCVLIELDGQEVRLVATDRYRLAVRVLRSPSIEGGPCRILVDAAELRATASWAVGLRSVSLEINGGSAQFHGDGSARELPAVEETFPAYRVVLDTLPAVRSRVITGRETLRQAIALGSVAGPITLHTDEQRLVVSRRGSTEIALRALCTGPPLHIAFDREVLLPALDASVGPDVLLEISSTTEPVTVRSADQGSFTTLVMPVRVCTTDD